MTIIALTDFSPTAENALRYAASMAKMMDYKLIIYHSYTIPLHAAHAHISGENFQRLLDSAVSRLQKNADAIATEYAIDVITECSFANLEEQLGYFIVKYVPKVLVLGMPEKSLEQDLMGNITTTIIKDSSVPVLAVPIEAKFTTSGKVVFACDNTNDLPQDIVEKVKDTIRNLGGELEIFSVETEIRQLKSENSPALALNAVDAHLQGINYYYKNVRSNAVVNAIRKEVVDSGANLLIMVPKRYGFWESLVHRSKTRMMASGLNIPLLTIPKL